MKDKIYNFIGETIFLTLKFGLAIMACIVISVIVFEDQKEEIFLEAVESFQMMYDTKEQELYNRLGIIDEDDVDQGDYKYAITNIKFKKSSKEKKTPKLITNSAIICAKKIFPDDSNLVTESMMDEVNQCIDQQITDAFIIGKVYMDEVAAMPDGTAKTIMQAIIVECDKKNKIVEQGVTDYTGTLQCIREDMKKLGEMIDDKLFEKRKQMGKVI